MMLPGRFWAARFCRIFRTPEGEKGLPEMTSLEERWRGVLDTMSETVRRAGRGEDSVRLVAVSKFHPASDIAELCRLGRFRREVFERERDFFPARRQPEAERDGKHECSRKQ